LLHRVGALRWIIKLWFYDNNKLTSGLHVLLTEFGILIRSANDFIAYRFLALNIWDVISVLSMRLVMFVRISRCPEYRSSYLPFEENHAQAKCANLTTEIVFKSLLKWFISDITIVHPIVLFNNHLINIDFYRRLGTFQPWQGNLLTLSPMKWILLKS